MVAIVNHKIGGAMTKATRDVNFTRPRGYPWQGKYGGRIFPLRVMGMRNSSIHVLNEGGGGDHDPRTRKYLYMKLQIYPYAIWPLSLCFSHPFPKSHSHYPTLPSSEFQNSTSQATAAVPVSQIGLPMPSQHSHCPASAHLHLHREHSQIVLPSYVSTFCRRRKQWTTIFFSPVTVTFQSWCLAVWSNQVWTSLLFVGVWSNQVAQSQCSHIFYGYPRFHPLSL